MESSILNQEVDVKVEPVDKSTTKWVNTEGSCFLCLETSTNHRVVMPLRLLFRHLKINFQEVYYGNAGSTNKKWKNIRVDLCKSCGATHSRLLALLQGNQLEKGSVQMEVNHLLEETNKIICESGGKPKLVKKVCAKMRNNPRTPFTFDFLDNLRKMIAKKCTMMQTGRKPQIELDGNIEAVVGSGTEILEDDFSSLLRMQLYGTRENEIESSGVDSTSQGIGNNISIAEEGPSAQSTLHFAASPEPRRSVRNNKKNVLKKKENPPKERRSMKIAVASTSKQEAQSRGEKGEKTSKPRKSARLSKQEVLLEKGKRSAMAMTSGQKSKKISIASTSKQEAQRREGKGEETSKPRRSVRTNKNVLKNKENPPVIFSGRRAKKIAVASTSKQEAQSCDGKEEVPSKPRRSVRINKKTVLKKERPPKENENYCERRSKKIAVTSTSKQEAQSRKGNRKEPAKPRRSARRSQQEVLPEKEKRSAMTSGQKSRKNSIASASKRQESKSMDSKNLSSKYFTKNSTTGVYECKECDELSQCRSTIYKHYQSCHLKIKYHCDICKVGVFANRAALVRHRRICQIKVEKQQAKEKPKDRFVCEVCGEGFASQADLLNHRQTQHVNPDPDPFACDLCSEKFKTEVCLKQHKDEAHLERKMSCEVM